MDKNQMTLALYQVHEKNMLKSISNKTNKILKDSLNLDISHLEYSVIPGKGNSLIILKVLIEEHRKIKMLLNEQIKLKVDEYYLILSNSTEEVETLLDIISQEDI